MELRRLLRRSLELANHLLRPALEGLRASPKNAPPRPSSLRQTAGSQALGCFEATTCWTTSLHASRSYPRLREPERANLNPKVEAATTSRSLLRKAPRHRINSRPGCPLATTLPPEGGGEEALGRVGSARPQSPKTPRGNTDLTLRGSYRRPARWRANPLRGEVSLATRRTLSTVPTPADRTEQGFSHPTRLPPTPSRQGGARDGGHRCAAAASKTPANQSYAGDRVLTLPVCHSYHRLLTTHPARRVARSTGGGRCALSHASQRHALSG